MKTLKKSIVEKARMASEKLGFVSAQASLDKLAEIYRDVSFPKIPSGLDSHRKTESSHH